MPRHAGGRCIVNGSKSGMNAVLLVMVGLLVGFIGGYLVGQGIQPAATVGGTQTAATAAACPHALDIKDAWIVAGFRCPGTPDAQVLLSDCHCPTSHGIEDRVKSELANGKTGDQIRQELMAEYGDQLKFAGR